MGVIVPPKRCGIFLTWVGEWSRQSVNFGPPGGECHSRQIPLSDVAALHQQEDTTSVTKTNTDTPSDDTDNVLLAHTQQKTVHPGDLRHVLLSTMSKHSKGARIPPKSTNDTTLSPSEMTSDNPCL